MQMWQSLTPSSHQIWIWWRKRLVSWMWITFALNVPPCEIWSQSAWRLLRFLLSSPEPSPNEYNVDLVWHFEKNHKLTSYEMFLIIKCHCKFLVSVVLYRFTKRLHSNENEPSFPWTGVCFLNDTSNID